MPGGGGNPIPGSGIPKKLKLILLLPFGGIGGGSIIGMGISIGGGITLSPFKEEDSFDNK